MKPANRHLRPRPYASWLAALLCVGLLHGTVYAATPETERAEAKVIEAKAFFKSALYQDAAASYLQAFAISKKPATLFNAARAYEEAKLYAQAIALFEQYVQLPDTPADGRREANERIAHDHELLAAAHPATPVETAPKAPEAKPAEAKAPETKPAATLPADGKPDEAKPAEAAAAETVDTAPTAPPAKRANWVSWALFAGGDTLLLIGLLGYSGAVNTVNQANAMDFSVLDAEASYKTKVSNARATRTSSVILAVVGAGLAGWGAWRLWGPGSDDAPAKSASWLLPTVAPDAAGVAWGGRF